MPVKTVKSDTKKYFCQKCEKTMSENNFFSYRSGEKCEMCKACLSMHIDNFDPNTFTWILKKLDFPYFEEEWNVIRDREWAKNPNKFGPTSVIGRYVGKMRLKKFMDLGWDDADRVIAEKQEKAKRQAEEHKAEYEVYKRQFENGEISEAEFKTYAGGLELARDYENEIPTTNPEKQKTPTELLQEAFATQMRAAAISNSGNPALAREQMVIGQNNFFNENDFLSENEMIDPSSNLTQEDKLYLAMKWGRLYKPNEWIELERKYNEMMHSFDIEDSDTIASLILICKTYLKMNQALDTNDLQGYTQLSRAYDQLRKSSKFTAAQKKEDTTTNFIDCVGNLVAYCEKEGGKIPRYDVSIDYDALDKEINNVKAYTKSLFYGDPMIARQIEDYIKRREVEEEVVENEIEANGETIELTHEDFEESFQIVEEEREHDERVTSGKEDE